MSAIIGGATAAPPARGDVSMVTSARSVVGGRAATKEVEHAAERGARAAGHHGGQGPGGRLVVAGGEQGAAALVAEGLLVAALALVVEEEEGDGVHERDLAVLADPVRRAITIADAPLPAHRGGSLFLVRLGR
jgi:hypothetical protein